MMATDGHGVHADGHCLPLPSRPYYGTIPFRPTDCPIRRAQASSLLGNAYSLMIATISPTAAAIKHTRNTLHYAGTASTITLAPPKTVEDDAEVRRLPGNYLIASKLPDCLSNDLPDDLSQCLSNDLPDDLSDGLSDDLSDDLS